MSKPMMQPLMLPLSEPGPDHRTSPEGVRSNVVHCQSGSASSKWQDFVDRVDRTGPRTEPWTGIYL